MHTKNAEGCVGANIVIITAVAVIIDFEILEYIFNLAKKLSLKHDLVQKPQKYIRNTCRLSFF